MQAGCQRTAEKPRFLFTSWCQTRVKRFQGSADTGTRARKRTMSGRPQNVGRPRESWASSTIGTPGNGTPVFSVRLPIRKGTELVEHTCAGDLFGGNNVMDRLSEVDGVSWSGASWASDLALFEHSTKVASDSVLTFLWHRY